MSGELSASLKLNLKAIADAQAAEAAKRPRFEPLPADAFPAASLTAWLRVARDADVPAVPAQVIGMALIDPLLSFDDPEVRGTPEFVASLAIVDRANQAMMTNRDCMARWDCCAPLGIKELMHEGAPVTEVQDAKHREYLILQPDDPRAFDILFDHPDVEVAVLTRPWIKARYEGSHPVEFRVFVKNGRVVAVSNYYPQRDLQDTPENRGFAQASCALAERMLAGLKAGGLVPWATGMRGIPESVQRSINCTLDFLVTQDDEVLFLEAGPGYRFGAHPCCFLVPDTSEVLPLEGLCLAAGKPVNIVEPLESFRCH